MQVRISNKSKIGLGPVVIYPKNKIAKVNFSRISKSVAAVALGDLTDVSVAGQQNGDVLVYNSNTNTYIIETLPKIDGGLF